MDWLDKMIFFIAFLILTSAIDGILADTMVTGTVFCDQCKDGQISLFDYPVHGIKVALACGNSNGGVTVVREETTNWLGSYSMRFDGTPDLSGCYAQVSGTQQGSTGCGAASGPAKTLRLMFSLFDMAMYGVDTLLSQPAQPISSCPKSTRNPIPSPATPVKSAPKPVKSPPPFSIPPVPHLPRLPPLPPLPPMPPVPFLEASACSHQDWTVPEHRCYWRVVSPDTKVANVFGMEAARRYGTNMTLWAGLQGRGDPYRTLLREGTTALLNSYNSIQFPYHSIGVLQHMHWALTGSSRNLLLTALRFKRANSGSPTVTCKFKSCK